MRFAEIVYPWITSVCLPGETGDYYAAGSIYFYIADDHDCSYGGYDWLDCALQL